MIGLSPERIFTLRDSSFANDLFIAAVGHFDFFNRVNGSSYSREDICTLLDIRERPADVMLSLFKAYGFVTETGSRFSLTETAREYLLKDGRYDLSSYVGSLKERPVCLDMVHVLHTGKTANWAAGRSGQEWARAMEQDSFAAEFTAGMNSRGAYLAEGLADAIDLSGSHRLLDIGGATGIYAMTLLEKYPGLSGAVFEKPPVDRIARLAIEQAGKNGRMNVYSGDMFTEELPVGYDVHLLSHVLHDWEVPQVRHILENSRRNLAPGGMIVIHDTHLNEDKTGPISVAEYSVLLMFSSQGKCYSVGELRTVLEETGFRDIDFRPTILNRSIVTARKA